MRQKIPLPAVSGAQPDPASIGNGNFCLVYLVVIIVVRFLTSIDKILDTAYPSINPREYSR